MSDALAVIEQRAVTFYDDQVVAVAVEVNKQREVYIPLKPLSVQAYQLAQAVEERLETVEAAMAQLARSVTQDEASQISQAVKAVALAIGKKSGRNEFGAVGNEDTAWGAVAQIWHHRLQTVAGAAVSGGDAVLVGVA